MVPSYNMLVPMRVSRVFRYRFHNLASAVRHFGLQDITYKLCLRRVCRNDQHTKSRWPYMKLPERCRMIDVKHGRPKYEQGKSCLEPTTSLGEHADDRPVPSATFKISLQLAKRLSSSMKQIYPASPITLWQICIPEPR